MFKTQVFIHVNLSCCICKYYYHNMRVKGMIESVVYFSWTKGYPMKTTSVPKLSVHVVFVLSI